MSRIAELALAQLGMIEGRRSPAKTFRALTAKRNAALAALDTDDRWTLCVLGFTLDALSERITPKAEPAGRRKTKIAA